MRIRDHEQVPVLIVGGGYAGLASSLFLSHHGVHSLLVDRHAGVSLHGRARAINPRTMEIYRAFGVAPAVYEAGKPFENDAGVVRCETLAAEWYWLVEQDGPRSWPDLTAGEVNLADQNAVEPVLIEAARARGADQRFTTQMVSFEPDSEGVSAVIEHRETGQRRTVRADYLIAADGQRSSIREQLGHHPHRSRRGPKLRRHRLPGGPIGADVSARHPVVHRQPDRRRDCAGPDRRIWTVGCRRPVRPGAGVTCGLRRRALCRGDPRGARQIGHPCRDRGHHLLGAGCRRRRPVSQWPCFPRWRQRARLVASGRDWREHGCPGCAQSGVEARGRDRWLGRPEPARQL